MAKIRTSLLRSIGRCMQICVREVYIVCAVCSVNILLWVVHIGRSSDNKLWRP
jgi:hypothetical protein